MHASTRSVSVSCSRFARSCRASAAACWSTSKPGVELAVFTVFPSCVDVVVAGLSNETRRTGVSGHGSSAICSSSAISASTSLMLSTTVASRLLTRCSSVWVESSSMASVTGAVGFSGGASTWSSRSRYWWMCCRRV